MAKSKFVTRDSRSGRFVVGRDAMTKLNAMEGIVQSASSRAMFAEFDRRGTPNEERRRAIIAKHSKKG